MLRWERIQFHAEVLTRFQWPSPEISRELLQRPHKLAQFPGEGPELDINLLASKLEDGERNMAKLTGRRQKLAELCFRDSLCAFISECCSLADPIGEVILLGYIDPTFSAYRCNLQAAFKQAKQHAQRKHANAHIFLELLGTHAGEGKWRQLLGLLRNSIIHGDLASCFESVDGWSLCLSPAGRGADFEAAFETEFGDESLGRVDRFIVGAMARVSTLLGDCAYFEWPKA
jgi:hypothetical protein